MNELHIVISFRLKLNTVSLVNYCVVLTVLKIKYVNMYNIFLILSHIMVTWLLINGLWIG
jgi:hypothetical protein